MFTPWSRPATLKNLSFLCHSLDQSSFFLLHAVISWWLVTHLEDETVYMTRIEPVHRSVGQESWASQRCLFIKGLFKMPPFPEKSHLSHHQVPLRMCKLLLTTRKPQHRQRIRKWVFIPEKMRKPQLRSHRQKIYLHQNVPHGLQYSSKRFMAVQDSGVVSSLFLLLSLFNKLLVCWIKLVFTFSFF